MTISTTYTLRSDRDYAIQAGELRRFLKNAELPDEHFLTVTVKPDDRHGDSGYLTLSYTTTPEDLP